MSTLSLVPASEFCTGAADCITCYEWLYFSLELINSVWVGEERRASCMAGLPVLQNKLPSTLEISAIRSSDDVGISSTSACTQLLTHPEAGRNISTHCQQSHGPAADLRQVLVLGYPLSQLHCCFALISRFSLPKIKGLIDSYSALTDLFKSYSFVRCILRGKAGCWLGRLCATLTEGKKIK